MPEKHTHWSKDMKEVKEEIAQVEGTEGTKDLGQEVARCSWPVWLEKRE